MPAYVFVEVDVHDPAAYKRYAELAPAAVAAHGGRYLARGGRTATLEGEAGGARVAILEFPTLDRAREWWSSDQYAAARTVREGAARVRMVAVEGV